MKTNKRLYGDKGEDAACQYLQKNGYSIIGRNYMTRYGEIDIIAQKGNSLHFIEVKTHNKESSIKGEENITIAKLNKIHKTINFYLLEKNTSQKQCWQIDAIIIEIDRKNSLYAIKHFENINIS